MYERCKFCKTFWEIPKKYWTNSHRKCPIAEKFITVDDGCKKLELTPYIRCMKFDEQVPTLACIQREFPMHPEERICKYRKYRKPLPRRGKA